MASATVGDTRNYFDLGAKLYDNHALMLMAMASTTATGNVIGSVSRIEG